MKRTYVGALARGHVHLPTRTAPFVRGEAIEVTADEAAVLNPDEWSAGKATPSDPPAQPEPDQPAKGKSKES